MTDDEQAFTSPLWQCEACGAWIDASAGTWRWTGTAWEHGGHDGPMPQAGHFPARRFATVAEAVAAQESSVRRALAACADAMGAWVARGDGVPFDAWQVLTKARAALGLAPVAPARPPTTGVPGSVLLAQRRADALQAFVAESLLLELPRTGSRASSGGLGAPNRETRRQGRRPTRRGSL